MRDLHAHILPGVDDGARDLAQSEAMLEAARAAGVTQIVCTPHVRDPYFDYDAMRRAYERLVPVAQAHGIGLRMGWEVNHEKLMVLGFEQWAPRLGFEGGREFLLELSVGAERCDFRAYERSVYELQAMGYEVIIAHPERYRAVQRDLEVAQQLHDLGCKLQASADFVKGGRLGREKRPAKKLFARGLYDLIASDAHRPEHYELFRKACAEYGEGASERVMGEWGGVAA